MKMILLGREEMKTLDFIINYDIKYRMGGDAEESREE